MRGGVLRSAALAVLLLASCQRREPAVPGFDAAAGLAKVRAARARVDAARATLRALGGSGGVGPGQPAARQAGDPALAEARAAFDGAYAEYQHGLAAFLTTAIARAPATAETREALSLYGREAVADAEAMARQGGDRRRAVALLRTAAGYFQATGASPPAELTAALRRLSAATPAPDR